MGIPFVVSGEGNDLVLTLQLDGQVAVVTKEHPAFAAIKRSLKSATVKEMKKLVDTVKAVETFVENASIHLKGVKAEVRNGEVFLNGEAVHNAVANRIKKFIQEGLPFEHLLRFLERVSANPSYTSQKELYDFLENKGLPITEDGCFVAYKAVRSDYLDKYSGTIDNRPGSKVRVARGAVDDNRANECSKGLHVGALDYVGWYGHAGDKLVVCKVDPIDVVSVPKDHHAQKCRTCAYEVLRDFDGELTKALYDAKAENAYGEADEDDDNWDFADDDHDEYVDDYYDDEDDDYDDEDEDDFDDDEDEDEDCGCPEGTCLGVKPSGQRFYNGRDNSGRFAPRKR